MTCAFCRYAEECMDRSLRGICRSFAIADFRDLMKSEDQVIRKWAKAQEKRRLKKIREEIESLNEGRQAADL